MNDDMNDLTHRIIGCAIEVHKELGPGLLESAYQHCLAREFEIQGIQYEQEVALPIEYKECHLECGYRLDLVVENRVIIELKAVKEMIPIYDAQLLSYLKLSGISLGLLINFNVSLLKDGIQRFRN